MSKPKFTPGPWRYVYNGIGGEEIGVYPLAPDTGGRIAEMDWTDRPIDVAAANSHLIAKAPEMYDQLADIGDAAERALNGGDATELLTVIRDHARALLAEIDGDE